MRKHKGDYIMNKFVKSLINTISLVAFFFSMSIESAQAATRLTPAHLYNWARTGNTARLEQFQKYINLHDHNKNTALCLAQRAKDRKSYSLLLDYGASTDVECHDDDDKVCAIIAGEKTKVHPAAFVLLGLGAAAGAYVLLDDDDDDYKCLPQNNEFSSRSDCEANNIGYTCEKNNNGCYIRGVASQCPAGYSTAYQSVADCGQYPEGWIYEQNDYSGELNCGKCTAKTCSIGETKCAEASTGFVSAHTTNGIYAGDTACLTCNYECDTTNGYYDSDTQCQDGGYICSTVTQNGKSCYIRTGSEQCPITHPSETPCETETEAFTNGEQSIQVGFRTCYSCNYQCNTSNGWQDGYCQAGRVCDDIDSPVTCHKDNGCPSSHPYTNKSDCESNGWVCEESATGSGCWKQTTTEIQCPVETSTDAQRIEECGTTGVKGYDFEGYNAYSGGKQCTKCTPRECDDGSTEITSTINCSTDHPEGYEIENVDYSGEVSCNKCRALSCEEQGYISDFNTQCENVPEGISAIGDGSDNVFSGESPCYKCAYICNTPSWKPTCPDGNTCSQSSTAPDNSLTCYKPDGCDESKGYYDDPSECETANTGYNCTQTTLNDVQCYIRGEQLDCPTTHPSDTPCQKGTGYNTVEDELQWGSKTCYKCEYSCDTSSGYYNDSSECPTTGANGWYLTNQVNVDSLTCGTCAPYQCATGNSTDYTDIIKCPTANYIHADDVNTGSNVAGGTASGNDICNKCTYICDYDSIEDCEEEMGNSCTQTNITIPDNSGNTISCPIPQTNTCPSTHPNSYTDKTACEEATGHTCTPHPQNNTCFFIETTCPTGYTTYASQSACESATGYACEQHSAGTPCYRPTTTCPSGYTSQTQEECQATGWVCEESATGSGCWKQTTTETGCSSGVKYCQGYSDSTDSDMWYSSYTLIPGVYSGGEQCKICEYHCNNGNKWFESCPTNYTCVKGNGEGVKITCYKPNGCDPNGAYPTENACSAPTGTTLIDNASITSGTQTCYTCTYGCDATQGYYDNRTDCINGGYTCSEEATELATNTDGTSVKCYKREGIFQCSTSGTEYTSDTECEVHDASAVALNQTSTTINNKTCYKCEYQCNPGYLENKTCESVNADSRLEVISDSSFGKDGVILCHLCQYACSEEGSYADDLACQNESGHSCTLTDITTPDGSGNTVSCYIPNSNCPTGYDYTSEQRCAEATGKICESHPNNSNCWKPTTNTFDCTTLGYYETACTNGTYYTSTSTRINDATTEFKTCYQCTYTCSNSSTEGLTDCSSKSHPEGWTYYSEETPDGKTCGICQVKSTCSNGGQIEDCGQFGDGESILSYNLFDLTENKIDSYRGDTQCHTCKPICKTGNSFSNSSDCESYGNGAQCISVNSADVYNRYSTSITCWYQNGCKTGYTERLTEEVCAKEFETYIYESANFHNGQTNTSHVCGKCTESKCPATYNGQTVVTSVDQCGTTGADGWTFTEIEADEGLTCGYCTAKTCDTVTEAECTGDEIGDSIDINRAVFNVDFIRTSYAGDEPCGTCSAISCNTTTSGVYDNATSCPSAAECISNTSNGITCYTTGDCQRQDGYDTTIDTTKCDAENGTVESDTFYSFLYKSEITCRKCVYPTCDTTIGEYNTQDACQEENLGFTCTQSQSGSCYKVNGCTGTNFKFGTSTTQIINDGLCSSLAEGSKIGADGWHTINEKTSLDGKVCAQCEANSCPTGTATELASCAEDPNGYLVSNSWGPAGSGYEGSYSGDVACNVCGYSCSGEDPAYSSDDACRVDYDSCTTYDFTSPLGTTVTCFVPTDFEYLSLSDEIAVSNTDKIELTSTGTEDIYGIQTAENTANTTSLLNGEVGSINITHNSTGSAYGMYGTSDNTLMNTTGASINIQNNSTGSATGMYVSTGGKAYNSGDINITGTTGTAIGIYGEGQNTIENSGTINVSGTDAYGIYVKDGTDTTVTNTETGTITVNATNNAHGIYIDTNSTNAVVENKGIITVNGEVKDGSTGITLNGASLKNYSLVRFSDITDLNALGGKVYLEDGGVYEAKSLEGDLNIGTSNVTGENKDTYIKENSIVAETTDNLNLVSESALFTAEKQKNEQGDGYNVVMNRKDFGEFTPNASIKSYLESNYKDGEMVEMFDSIKSQNSGQGASEAIAGELGYDVMPNFADENFIVMKSLNRNIADTILKPTDEANRVVAGYDNISLETENKALLSGADLSANSMYTFGDKRLDNKNRLGLGLSFTELSSSYEKGGDRDVSIISIFMPYLHKFSDKLRLASVLSVGYGTGEYERGGNNESDISDIFYGFTNELRYTIDLNGYAELEPALMLNAIGYTEDGFDEGDGENALETKKTHNLSVEAGIGLFLKKEVQTNEHGKIGFRVGGAYYRELATPYDKIDARLKRGNASWYRINDYANLYDHDRAILEAAVDYEYKSIGLYAKYNRLIQKNNPELFDLGIKYKF